MVQKFDGFSIVHALTLCLSSLSPTHGSVHQESGFGGLQNHQRKINESCFPFYPEAFVLGDSTVFTTLEALPCDTVLRPTSSPSSGRMSPVFGIIIHFPILLLSTFVQKCLNST